MSNIAIDTPGECTSYMEIDMPTEDQAERLIKELSLQLDRINDHLNGIERALSQISDNPPTTEWRRSK